jgi:pyruvate dehydrogenase phosphatase
MEYVHPYPGDDEAEKLLRQHETSRTFRPITSNGVVRFDNNWVGSNDPIEDRHVEHYLSRNILSSTSAKGSNEIDLELTDQLDSSSLKLFSVIDGHAGYATADVLAKDLHPRVIKSLQSLYAGNEVDAVDPMLMMRQLQRADYRSFLRKYFELEGAPRRSSAQVNSAVPITSRGISDAITSAFVGLDYDICSGPLRLIANANNDVNTKAGVKSISEPATNGACALTVMVDEDRQEVYIANTGDSRAVAGYYVKPQTDSNGFHYHGGWRCEVLTEDHTANGPKELQRYAF